MHQPEDKHHKDKMCDIFLDKILKRLSNRVYRNFREGMVIKLEWQWQLVAGKICDATLEVQNLYCHLNEHLKVPGH